MSKAQNYEGGIRLTESNQGLDTYEIKLVSLPNAASAQRLENAFLQKEGFHSVSASEISRICTLTVNYPLRKRDLNDVVEYAGFEVAKSFEE